MSTNRWRLTLPVVGFAIAALLELLGLRQQVPIQAQTRWSQEEKLATNAPLTAIKANGASVNFVYSGFAPQLFQRRSADAGQTWDPSRQITVAKGNIGWIQMTRNGSHVYVIWQAGIGTYAAGGYSDLYLKTSTDGGLTWGPDKQLTSHARAMRFDIAVSGPYVHIVYFDWQFAGPGGNWGSLHYMRSPDGGNTWSPAVKLRDTNASRPVIRAFGKYVHLAWIDGREGTSSAEIYYKRSVDNGATWEPDRRLTVTPTWSGRPDLAVNETGVVYLAYDDDSWGTFVMRSTDHGQGWQASGKGPRGSNHPSIEAARSSVHVVGPLSPGRWEDRLAYYMGSTDNGVTWTELILSSIPGTSGFGVTVAENVVIATYERRGTVYYRRSRLSE